MDYGTALSPIYLASQQGKEVFVYADETRPRGQGARLTAWELKNENIPHAIIPDNAGAYLMARGKIDMIIVGADRIARNGETMAISFVPHEITPTINDMAISPNRLTTFFA